MKKFLPLLLILFTLTLAGCTSAKDSPSEPLSEMPDQVAGNETEIVIENEVKKEEALAPDTLSVTAGSIYEYQALLRNNSTNAQYKTSEPLNVMMIKDITPEGTGFWNSELWGPADWQTKSGETVQNFYIKNTASQPNDLQGITTWFGPFKGQLGLLVQEAHEDQRFYSNLQQ